MTVSAFYYPHRLLEHGGDCQHAVKDSTSESIAVLLIALAASEVVIIVVCKIMAWYANLVFYSQDWDDEAKPQEHKSTSPDTIAQSLHTFKYERRHYDCLSEESTCCPVCLVEFETNDSVSHGKASCHHMFHTECITVWLSKHSSCPCCRQDMLVSSSPTMWIQGDSQTQPFCLFVF